MPRYASPVHAPAAKKAAPSGPGPDPGGAGPRRSAMWHAIQCKAAQSRGPASAAKAPAESGLPAPLKAGIERLSGIAMDDVQVHRNSAEPAKLGAYAYTRGSEIHLGPGQERHLPHEAWHVVQQKQGRVAPTHQLKSIGINADPALEAEADTMGARALAGRAAPGEPPAGRPTATATAAPIQCAWRIIPNGSKSVVFWLDEGEGPIPNVPKPSAWAEYLQQPAPNQNSYYLAEGRAQRGKEPALGLQQWTTQYGGSTRGPSDTYNPFGRFTTATISSFVPSSEMPAERYKMVRKQLQESDKTFQPFSRQYTAKLEEQFKAKHSNASFYNQFRYPVMIVTNHGKVLRFVSATPFGASYSDVVPSQSWATHDPKNVKPATDIKWAQDATAKEEWSQVKSSVIDPSTLEAWHGKKRSKQQHEVMGASARDAAANAGFNPDEGEGWEWLHLIAHSMGGVEIIGPQVPGNLVGGTSECNTQMIIVEEFLKDIVTKTGGRARLHVFVKMFDTARHIGDRIHYDFTIVDKLDKPIAVYHWEFDCLSRTNPLVSQNRELRYAGRGVFGLGEKSDQPKGFEFGSKSKFDPSSLLEKPKGGGLEKYERERAITAMSKERRSQVAVMLGLDPSAASPENLYALLEEQPFDVVLDIVRGTSVEVSEKNVGQNVNLRLSQLGLSRRPSDAIGFICLIDSIHQLLAGQQLGVDRNQLIQAVHNATGRTFGQMLEIIGDEGQRVMAAVDGLVFATHHRHITLVAHVFMVMPDGGIVPFYNASRYAAPGGEVVDLQLLFVNNNHYEPLFDAPGMDTSTDVVL